jgi:hypothetical protein
MSLGFKDCHAKIRQVDCQETVGGAVVIQVICFNVCYVLGNVDAFCPMFWSTGCFDLLTSIFGCGQNSRMQVHAYEFLTLENGPPTVTLTGNVPTPRTSFKRPGFNNKQVQLSDHAALRH